MSDTTYTDNNTLIISSWLNDVNVAAYRAIGAGGAVPTTPAQVVTNLGVPTLLQLSDLINATNGAGLSSFVYSLAYAPSTVGFELKGKPTVVSSIAALRALPKTGNPTALPISYYAGATPDGGGGVPFSLNSGDTSSGCWFSGSVAPGPVAPAAPTLTQVASGSQGARTEFFKITYVTAAGETLASAEASIAVLANQVAVVTSPSATTGATGYYVYGSTSSGAEQRQQTSAPIAIGVNWQEPAAGLLVGGPSVPTSSTSGSILTIPAAPFNGTVITGHRLSDQGGLVAVNTYVVGQITGTGGSGTYTLNGAAQTIVSSTMVTDNGGTTIVAFDGGRWNLSVRESVTNLQFGAFLTSAAGDSTGPIQSAMNYCSQNNKILLQVGQSKITSPLNTSIFGITGVRVIGVGPGEGVSGEWVYTGTGTMMLGTGTDVKLFYCNFEKLAFTGPGNTSGVNGLNGQFFYGGLTECLVRAWGVGVQTFGSLASFKFNSFNGNGTGLWVTNWPAGSSQANASTTTIRSYGNDYTGNTNYGARWDTSTTGGGNFVSSGSHFDTYEGNGVGLYLNKTFSFVLDNPHFERSTTNSLQAVNSNPTIIHPYYSGTDGSKISITFPGAAANTAGYAQTGGFGPNIAGVNCNYLQLTTLGTNLFTMTVLDSGVVNYAGAGLDFSSVPLWFSTGGVLQNAKVTIGVTATAPAIATYRVGTTSTFTHVKFTNDTGVVGSISENGTTTAYNTTSDSRLKNISGPVTDSGKFIDALRPVEGTWKTDGSPFVGFVTDEYGKVDPSAVQGVPDMVDEEGKPVYQQMEYGSPAWCANVTAELQSLRGRLKKAGL